MKKTVQIVTIPLDKKGFSINDLIKKPAFDAAGEIERWKISYYGMSTGIWKAHQLLVLSDDEIKINDMYYASGSKTLEYSVFKADTARLVKIGNELGVKKVIASYPQIEGTLPISQEFIQQYVQSQGKGVVYIGIEEKCVDVIEPVRKYYNETTWIEIPKIDKAGNAILSIEQEVTDPLSRGLDYIKENNIQLVNKPPVKETTQETVVTAAMEWYKEMLGGRSVIKPGVVKAAFIEGAAWQEEQTANEAIEFFQWATNSTGNGYIYPGKEKAEKLFNNEYPTNEQLYELWQQTKEK